MFAGVFSEVVSSCVFRKISLFSLASFSETFIPSGKKKKKVSAISNQHPPIKSASFIYDMFIH